MRFCDFFTSYKIELKSIERTIPFIKLPLYRKVFAIAFLAFFIISAILYMLNITVASVVFIVLAVIWALSFSIIDSMKNNLETMLKDHYIPYSKKRMNMIIKVLQTYSIDIRDFDSIDRLIAEAQNAQTQCDPLAPLKKSVKTLSTLVIPIIAFAAKKIGDAASQDDIIVLAVQAIIIIILVFSLIFLVAPIIKYIFYQDYNKYDELIYDLRQIKIFYANENFTAGLMDASNSDSASNNNKIAENTTLG